MRKIFISLSLIFFSLIYSGCTEQVPAGYKGKILGTDGYHPEVIEPSRTTVGWREKLILIETTTKTWEEPVSILLSDKLTLHADIKFRARITSDKKNLNAIFNDINVNNDLIVNVEDVYNIYGKMIVQNKAREVISQYTIDDINKNYSRISGELYGALQKEFLNSPIELSDVVLGNIRYPKIVTDAIDKAKQRRMEIEEEKAKTQKELIRVQGLEQIAKAEYNIKMLEAKRIRDYNKMIAEGVTPELIQLRKLEVQEQMVQAIKNNQNVIYMPMDMMNGTGHIKALK